MKIEESIRVEPGVSHLTFDELRAMAIRFVEAAGGKTAAAQRMSERGSPIARQSIDIALRDPKENPRDRKRPGVLMRIVSELNPDPGVTILMEEAYRVTAKPRRGRRSVQ